MRGNFLLVLGSLFLIFSFVEIANWEYNLSRYEVASYGWRNPGDPPLHFQVKCLGNRTIFSFHGQKVVLSDQFKMPKMQPNGAIPYDYKSGLVNITINGRDYSVPWSVNVRTAEIDANRYFSEVMVAEIMDKREGKMRLAVLQSSPNSMSGDFTDFDLNSMKCRILFVDTKGNVEEELFTFDERDRPPYRELLADYVSPLSLGVTWHGPRLYSAVSAILGIILLLVARVKFVPIPFLKS